MKHELEELSSVARKLSFVVSKERVNAYLNRAFQAISQKVKLNGYRPGKAPRVLLERLYGQEASQKALEKLVAEVVFEALKERAIQPITKPKVKADQVLLADQEFVFSAEVEILPEVSLKQWERLAVELPARPEIDDVAVGEELEKLRTRAASFEPIEDREVTQLGDYVEFSYLESCGADEHQGHEHKPQQRLIELGKKTFYPEKPEIEQALIGAIKNQPVQIGDMTLTVEEIKHCLKPDLDNEFAKDLSDKFETLEDLKSDIRDKLTQDRIFQLERDKKEAVLDALIEVNPIEVPEGLVLEQAQHMAADRFSRFPKELASQMWKMYGESLIESAKPNAAKLIKANLLLDAIAKQEGISPEAGSEQKAADYFDKMTNLVLERARLS